MLIDVHAGVPPGGPVVAPAIGALVGGAAAHWVPARAMQSPVGRIVAFCLLGVLVGTASVYVVAAIALSRFE